MKVDHMTSAQYREMLAAEKRPKNKYNAKKTKLDGRTYDSQREANRAAELKLLEKAGEVIKIWEQVPFDLPGDIKYRADFVILWRDGSWTVEDVKGVLTDVYKIKKKLMRERYGIVIEEVT